MTPLAGRCFDGSKPRLTRVITGEERLGARDLLAVLSLQSSVSAKATAKTFAADERSENSFEFQVSSFKGKSRD